MSAEPDALAVVTQLRDLAADPMNRRAIVQDQGCLPGLILFLDHPNPQVVYAALLVSRRFLHLNIKFASSCCRLPNCDWLFPGDPLPGRMPRQPGEAEGRAGDDAEPPERRAEVSL